MNTAYFSCLYDFLIEWNLSELSMFNDTTVIEFAVVTVSQHFCTLHYKLKLKAFIQRMFTNREHCEIDLYNFAQEKSLQQKDESATNN